MFCQILCPFTFTFLLFFRITFFYRLSFYTFMFGSSFRTSATERSFVYLGMLKLSYRFQTVMHKLERVATLYSWAKRLQDHIKNVPILDFLTSNFYIIILSYYRDSCITIKILVSVILILYKYIKSFTISIYFESNYKL